jgi:hypothetical protein
MRSRACCCLSHRTALITGSVLVALVLAMLAGCQGLPANVANCSVTPPPPTNTSVVPPATEPPPAALCAFPLTIATPRNSASGHSPVPIVANAAPPDRITPSGFTWMALRSFERVGDQVHYLSVSVADQTYTVDMYYPRSRTGTRKRSTSLSRWRATTNRSRIRSGLIKSVCWQTNIERCEFLPTVNGPCDYRNLPIASLSARH